MRTWVTVSILGVLLAFQNCNNVDFKTDSEASSLGTSTGAPSSSAGSGDAFGDVLQGLKGGHFDLDTATAVYAPSAGDTNHHVHEYDDKFNVTYADYFNLKDAKFDNIQEVLSPSQRFVLIIANADLSPGGVLSVNGVSLTVGDYQKKVAAFMGGNSAALPVFSLDGSSGQKLSALKIGFAPDALMNGGLIGTLTSCVVGNDPGRLGEYRNGALIIQAIDANLIKLSPITKTAELNGGLLWESTIFWHWDNGCYK